MLHGFSVVSHVQIFLSAQMGSRLASSPLLPLPHRPDACLLIPHTRCLPLVKAIRIPHIRCPPLILPSSRPSAGTALSAVVESALFTAQSTAHGGEGPVHTIGAGRLPSKLLGAARAIAATEMEEAGEPLPEACLQAIVARQPVSVSHELRALRVLAGMLEPARHVGGSDDADRALLARPAPAVQRAAARAHLLQRAVLRAVVRGLAASAAECFEEGGELSGDASCEAARSELQGMEARGCIEGASTEGAHSGAVLELYDEQARMYEFTRHHEDAQARRQQLADLCAEERMQSAPTQDVEACALAMQIVSLEWGELMEVAV